jgi:hypothetical protein
MTSDISLAAKALASLVVAQPDATERRRATQTVRSVMTGAGSSTGEIEEVLAALGLDGVDAAAVPIDTTGGRP